MTDLPRSTEPATTGAFDPFHNDPFKPFYNLGELKTWSLTCDIDWAPDYAVADLFSVVESFGLPISAYATHRSDILLSAPDWVEVGLHPDNTRPHPEHGLKRKIPDLLDIYPDAVGVRAHRNFFGQNIASFAAEAGLKYDASVFQWGLPYLQAFKDQYGLHRLSYNWEDGVHADLGLPWDLAHVPINGPGMKIFNLHPIFFYLNAPHDDYRREVVHPYRDLQNAPEAELKSRRYTGYGARNFTIDLLRTMSASGAQAVRLDKMVAMASEAGR